MKLFLTMAVFAAALCAHGQRELPIHGGRLASDLNAGGHSITNLAPGFAGSIGALTNAAQFATPADVAEATEGMLTAESDPVALPVATNALALASTALQSEVDPVAYPVATNALALASTALQPGATNGMLTAEADPVALPVAESALVHAVNALPQAGGAMAGPLVLDGAAGITFCGVGLSTNFIVRVEHDGTNWNWNVYEVAR